MEFHVPCCQGVATRKKMMILNTDKNNGNNGNTDNRNKDDDNYNINNDNTQRDALKGKKDE